MKQPRVILFPVDLLHSKDCPQHPDNKGKRNQSSGPSQVSTEDYRNGWDNVFGNKQPVGQA